MAGVINTITANNVTHPLASTVFATCNTASETSIKEVTSNNSIPVITGLTLPVYFLNSNTNTGQIYLRINGGHTAPVYRYGTTSPGPSINTSWREGCLVSFTYDGNAWRMNDYSETGTDTLNTAGSSNTNSKLYIIGSELQVANSQTYSNSKVYILNNKLYQEGNGNISSQIVDLTSTQALVNKTYNGYTLNNASSKAVDTTISSTASSNLPTSDAVKAYIVNEIALKATLSQEPVIGLDVEYRILLSSTDDDILTKENKVLKNEGLRYNTNLKTIYIDDIDNLTPQNNMLANLSTNSLYFQSGEENLTELLNTFNGSGEYSWNNFTLSRNLVEEVQPYDELPNPNLFLGSAMNTTPVNKDNTDFTKFFRYYNGTINIHNLVYNEEDHTSEDTITLIANTNIINYGISFVRLATDINLNSNTYYTLSCEAKTNKPNAVLNIGLSYYSIAEATWKWYETNSSEEFYSDTNTDWQTFTFVFKPSSDTQVINYCFTVSNTSDNNYTFSIRHCKLLLGNEVTPWVANEEDEDYNPVTTLNYYETNITAKEANFGGRISNDGTFTLGNTLYNDAIGLVTIGTKDSLDSIKLINNRYSNSKVEADLRGITMGNDGKISLGDLSYWTGYNPYQIQFRNKTDEIQDENKTPYNNPTSNSILNASQLLFMSTGILHVATLEDYEYATELNDKELKFMTRTWTDVPVYDEEDQPTGETERVLTTEESIINKASVDAWNSLLENSQSARFTSIQVPHSSGTISVEIPDIGYYIVILQKPNALIRDRMYLLVNAGSNGHITSILSNSPGSSTHHAGSITDETFKPMSGSNKAAFTFKSGSSASYYQITFIKLA